MRINTLRVENFRGFAEREFAFHPQFNVLIGDNATGKTATLEALSVALDPWIKGATGDRARSIEKYADVRVKANHEGGVIVLDRKYPCVVVAEFERDDIELAGRPLTLSTLREIPTPDARNRTLDTKGLEKWARSRMREASDANSASPLPLVAYYGTARRKSIKSSEKKRRVPQGQAALYRELGYRDALDARIDPRLFVDWMKRQALITSQDDNVEPLSYTATREALTALVDEATNVRYLFKAESVVVEFADGRVLPIDLLSDGQKGVLRLVGDLARRAALLNPGLEGQVLTKTPGVVLIDELGLHLHPNWQRRIADDLRRTFPAVQFIVASHSPLIIGEVEPESVLVLSAPSAKVPTASQSFGLDANRVMTWVMDTKEVQAPEVTERLVIARRAIQQGHLGEAQNLSDDVRELQRGPTPDTVELDTIIANLEALADDEDDHEN